MNIRPVLRIFYFVVIFLIVSCRLAAQQKVTDGRLIWLLSQQDSLRARLPIEKTYLQTDKPFYAVGDTIWFKAYVFDADYLHNTSRTGLLYIELANDSANIVSRMVLPLAYGLGYGQIAVDGKDIPEGSYTLRAYTNWMRNFGEDYIFSKNLYITGSNVKPWLVNVKTHSAIENDKENVQASLAFTGADNLGVLLREMHVKVQDNSRTLFSGKTQTDVAGVLNINFNLPAKADPRNLNLHTEDLRKGEGNRQMEIPLVLNRPENTDVQFMPEGGNLISGLVSKVAFKAVGEDGRGIDISGKLYNSKREVISSFTSTHKGMGNFTFAALAGESYTTEVTLPNGIIRSIPLPSIKFEGTAIRVFDPPSPADSLGLTVSQALRQQPAAYYLIGQSRGVVCYVRIITFERGNNELFSVPKSLFPTGIARFSLVTRSGQPLNERLVYIDHNDNLKINITPSKQKIAPGDSVALQIQVKDEKGKPVTGSFSLTVTDDDQVPADSLAENIISDLLFTSDLKGTIEQATYYLQKTPESKAALDNLLLTQGWVGYGWKQVTEPQMAKFEAEPEFKVQGNVTNVFNKPVPGSQVVLLSKKGGTTKMTKTDAKGHFEFTGFPIVDSPLYFVEGASKRGKNWGIGITVDQPAPPEFSKPAIKYLPWFVNTDTLLQKSVSKAISQRLEEEKLTGDHLLKAVEIREKKIVKGSYNLNGAGEADQVLDEHLMDKSGDMTLEELLEKNVKGFMSTIPLKMLSVHYMIGSRIANFVIDGVDIKTRGDYLETKSYLDNFTAKDIRGIEIMNSTKYRSAYDPDAIMHEIGCRTCPPPPMFVEVTTKANTGPNLRHTPGTYVYRPVQFGIPKQFYQPRYTIKKPGAVKDVRSTIFWEPNIITDKDGKAMVSFYASDKVKSYTLTLEGSDMAGHIGSLTQKLTGIKNSP